VLMAAEPVPELIEISPATELVLALPCHV
jgi:hypothetical protein